MTGFLSCFWENDFVPRKGPQEVCGAGWRCQGGLRGVFRGFKGGGPGAGKTRAGNLCIYGQARVTATLWLQRPPSRHSRTFTTRIFTGQVFTQGGPGWLGPGHESIHGKGVEHMQEHGRTQRSARVLIRKQPRASAVVLVRESVRERFPDQGALARAGVRPRAR